MTLFYNEKSYFTKKTLIIIILTIYIKHKRLSFGIYHLKSYHLYVTMYIATA
jgi:hypothetical protein